MDLTYIKQLREGKVVSFRPHGRSMTPKIESGQLVTVSPDIGVIKKGDILFCKVKGRMLCHLVSAVQGERYQISNNHNYINGWIGRNSVFGKVVKIEA